MANKNPFEESGTIFTYQIYLPVLNKNLDFTYCENLASLFLDMVPYDANDALSLACDCMSTTETLVLLFCVGKMICVDRDDDLFEDYESILTDTLECHDELYAGESFDFKMRLSSNKLLNVTMKDGEIAIFVGDKKYDKDALLLVIDSVDNIDDLSTLSHVGAMVNECAEDSEFSANLSDTLHTVSKKIGVNI